MELLGVGVGLALLVIGGDVLVRGANALAQWARVPPAVIGSTVVAGGTSAPELGVSMLSAYRGSPDLALGNVIGSNLYNIGLVLAIAALIRPCLAATSTVRFEIPVMLAASVALGAVAWDLQITRVEGALLALGAVGFLAETARRAVRDAADVEASDDGPLIGLGATGLGLVLLFAGAQLLVHGAVGIAEGLGVSERVIGLTVVAVGTSLPELFASAAAAWKGSVEVAIGNVVGSNLLNILGIVGPVALLAPLAVNPALLGGDLVWMLAFAFALGARLAWRSEIDRLSAAALLLGAAVYTARLIASA